MRKMIYKYYIPELPGTVEVIDDAILEVLDIQYQGDYPVMWALVDADSKIYPPMKIAAFGTGWEIPNEAKKYLGTLQDKQGYVWHYFTLNGDL